MRFFGVPIRNLPLAIVREFLLMDARILGARLKVEHKTLGMQDLKEHLKEDFKYSAQALEGMLAQEQQRNAELKKELEMTKYRKAVIESQFSDNELDRQ